MTIYIDSNFKCYVESAEDRTAVETSVFVGKCKAYIEGYRFVPAGQEWTRFDGHVFKGEMVAPWKDHAYLASAQAGYEESLAEIADMQEALALLNVTPTEEVSNG